MRKMVELKVGRRRVYITQKMVARLHQINRGFATAVSEPTCREDGMLLNAGLVEFRSRKRRSSAIDRAMGRHFGLSEISTSLGLTKAGISVYQKTHPSVTPNVFEASAKKAA